MGIVLGVGLASSSARAAAPLDSLTRLAALQLPAQTQPRLTRAHAALNSAIDSQRRGDYEQADALFSEALALQADLTPDERQELTSRFQANTLALKARREGAQQLRQAEDAFRKGNTSQAEELLKKVQANQSLTFDDKRRAEQLAGQIQPRGGDHPGLGSAGANPLVLARNKVQQARALLGHFDFDAAQQLATDAKRLNAPFTKSEDTPQKVLDDIARLRTDPKALLAAARAALKRGELDRAEHLAKESKKQESVLTVHLWGDSPSKVLEEIQAARAKQSRKTEVAANTPKPGEQQDPKPEIRNPNDPARQLLQQARQAYDKGDLDLAARLNDQARAKRPASNWWDDDSPDNLQKDIQRARASRQGALNDVQPRPGTTVGLKTESTTAAKPPPAKPEDVGKLVQQGREFLAAGKLDDAARVALHAKQVAAHAPPKSSWAPSWHLFEDTPDQLLKDVDKARHQHDVEESGRLLAEGRKLLQKGDLDGAARDAYKAEKLHGPYGMWDLGDRPNKLLADVQSAKDKKRPKILPPAPGSPAEMTMAQRLGAGGTTTPRGPDLGTAVDNPGTPGGTGVTPVAHDPQADQARQLLVQARIQLRANNPAAALSLVQQVEQMHVALNQPGDENVLALRLEIERAQTDAARGPQGLGSGQAVVQGPGVGTPPLPAVDPQTATGDPIKPKAQALLAEARQLQKEGKLIDARAKVVECQHLNVTYGPDEDRPEQILLQLVHLAGERMDNLIAEADDYERTALADPSRHAKAEADLLQARQLAASYLLDTFRIDSKIDQVRQSMAQAGGSSLPLPAVPVGYQPDKVGQAVASDRAAPGSKQGEGEQKLRAARLELRSGKTENARRQAEAVYRGDYGLQTEAEAVLRDIDREEFNQKCLTANHTFEAGQQAFNRRDYGQAAAIFRAIDPHLLEKDKQARLKEYMAIPEMQPRIIQQTAAVQGQADGTPGGLPILNQTPTDGLGSAQATDKGPSTEASYAAQVQALNDVKFQALRSQGQKAQRQAMDLFRAGDAKGALDALRIYLGELSQQASGGQMDPEQVALLRRPVEQRLQQLETLKAQQEWEANRNQARDIALGKRADKYMSEQAKQKQVTELMARFKQKFEEAKYEEAELLAMQAHDLDPDNPTAAAAIYMAKTQKQIVSNKNNKSTRNEMVLQGLGSAENEGPYADIDNPIRHNVKMEDRLKKRKPGLDKINIGIKSPKEQEIERSLSTPVTVNFVDTPLKKVLEDLGTTQGININIDEQAVEEDMISLDRPVTKKLDNISLKSALNILLQDAKLTWVVRNEVLEVTTESHSKEKNVVRVYQVADLVVPIQQANMPAYGPQVSAPHAGQQAPASPITTNPGATPYSSQFGLNGGQPVGSGTLEAQQNVPMAGGVAVVKQTPEVAMAEQLISLIKSAIAPKSWSDVGGQGTIDYHPFTMSLVVNDTPDIQEQVADLLDALRRLQDQEVAVELRFISVAESFYERIGVDFNVNILTDHNTKNFQPQLTTGIFQPGQQINSFQPSRFISGLTPAGTFTSDLDIPINASSFGMAIPPFGAFPNMPGANGGLDLGLAFLSDIQVFLFMEAAQGDQRTNVMQAPKLTLFNGQTASITVTDQQFFVTSVSLIQNGGQLVFVPTNTDFAVGGVTMFVQAVITADRRFVRLNVAPTIRNLVSALVPLFPIVIPVTQFFEGGGGLNNTVLFTQFVQQPVFNTITVMTTVMVPDGGTVLMGGLKRLSEGRNEFGPPVISKIPYINRLFTNVGYGRQVESLMLMVTPRIIIQEEEEERATGVVREAHVTD
jgi:type II secretory pathway component GspD/PulD (secretin)